MQEQGYLIVDGVLDSNQCRQVTLAIYHRIVETVFTQRGFKVDPKSLDTIRMLTDPALRAQLMGQDKDRAVFRHGLSRQPLVSKSTGMNDNHYIPEVLEHIAFNPKLYQVASHLYGQKELAFMAGIDRFCFKAPGSTQMSKHIDWCPFDQSGRNYPRRYQCLVTTSISRSVPPEKTGTLCLLLNFHHYTELARRIFYPRGGLVPFPDDNASWSRFFILPKNFDSHYLPALIEHAQAYGDYLHRGLIPADPRMAKIYAKLKSFGLSVPETYRPIGWQAISLRPGQAIFWDQRVPHYSAANKSEKVRACCYYSVFPIDQAWDQSSGRSWLRDQIRELRFSYDTEANIRTTKVRNPEELEYFKTHPEVAERTHQILGADEWRRKLTGVESWWG